LAEFAPELNHDYLLRRTTRMLGFDSTAYFPEWQKSARRTFRQLLGAEPQPVPLDLHMIQTIQYPDYQEIIFTFRSEQHADVPAHLLIPIGVTSPTPTMIVLQGHTTGMHISLGRAIYPGDEADLDGDRDFGLQAVRQGMCALVLELRCFGQRHTQRPHPVGHNTTCYHDAMVALLLGRTLAGERVWDISRAIDSLAHFPQVDSQRIGIMGNSGGGLISYYAAAMEPRIAACMPSCAICTYADSIGSVYHCADNYLPGVMQYFDMQDVAGLIAPRPLVIVSGLTDDLFPIAASRTACQEIAQIYQTIGKAGDFAHVVGPEGHRFYADLAWPVFRRITGW